jgi:hypothetical protein
MVEGCGCMAMAIVALADLSAKGQTQFMVLAQMGISPTRMVVYLTEVVGIIYPVAARSYGSIHIPDKNWGTKELNN